ncbi:hypothetical protein PV08_03256 [Exophiala spinifera]|uniref:Uncharacterized protein n=1 Tax=Exophiala spinifera TaxID=91928 RepID=A0A0D2A206_9EURO|nr:uncharacterized protein PV08_03256 [Exophiala spinifera]KIW18967.1 hypothetical protein PV08_03256 [Exophiala spinifera]
MPVLPSAFPTDILLDRSVTATNLSSHAVKVVCAWPVSGQYGPGTRFLFYALISACFFGREVEWLRAACLAAALLFPAVAALHGIVIAAVHVNGAVDMDVYGAFQVCSIGILLAPVTVMLSRSYFEQAGSSIIILWTALILAGLLSLTVEFFRTKSTRCTRNDTGILTPINARDFQYGNDTCGLICSVDQGPFSPMRRGSANNIYVIPAPDKLTFNAATLLAAACCVPALLLIISNWNKIREANALESKRLKDRTDDHEPEGTDLFCTCGNHEPESAGNRRTRNFVATPIFGAAILSILIIGEWNFFSEQVAYQTEPIASIGQWAPIVGTGLALVGSVYVLLAKDIVFEKREQEKRKQEKKEAEDRRDQEKTNPSVQHVDGGNDEPTTPAPASAPANPTSAGDNDRCPNCGRVVARDTNWTRGRSRGRKAMRVLSDWRRRGTRAMIKLVDFIGTAAEDTFENKKFRQAKEKWIQYPGEKYKNPALRETVDQYRRSRDLSSSANDQPRSRSASVQSRRDAQLSRLETGTTITNNSTNHSGGGGQRSSTTSSGAPLRRGTTDSLQVPPSIHHARTRDSLPPVSPTEPEVLVRGRGNRRPSVVVSDAEEGFSLASPSSSSPRHLRSDSQPTMSLPRPPHSWHLRSRQGTV